MKKLLVFLFLSLIIVNHSTAQNTYTAPLTATLPVFDGNGNDAVWSNAVWQNINQVWIPYNNILPSSFSTETGTQILSGANDFLGRYKILWSQNSNVIVFLVEITDDVFIGNYTQSQGGNYPNFDVLEIFIDENKSGGNHLFDSNGNNAENAFAYHMMVNDPGVGQITTSMTGAMDLAGTTFGNIVDYQSHFPNYSMKNLGNGNYVYEFSLKVYKDTYNNANPSASLKTLNANDLMGLSIAYCDNDAQDGLRDNFIASVSVSGPNNNNSYIDATIFGSLNLSPSTNLLVQENDLESKTIIFPNPFSKQLTVSIDKNIILNNAKFEIFNVSGSKIKSINLISNQSQLNLDNLSTEIYFYKIYNDEKIVGNGKLISK